MTNIELIELPDDIERLEPVEGVMLEVTEPEMEPYSVEPLPPADPLDVWLWGTLFVVVVAWIVRGWRRDEPS